MRIPAKTMETVMEQILLQHGAEAENAALTAPHLHPVQRGRGVQPRREPFSRLIGAVDRGVVDPKVRPVCTVRTGCMERWDGRRGLGTVNAHLAMERACALAKEQGMGLVALETPTTGCGAERTAGRRPTRAASAFAGPTPCPTCPPGEAWKLRRATIRW